VPALIIVLMMPLSFSISIGIGLGFIAYAESAGRTLRRNQCRRRGHCLGLPAQAGLHLIAHEGTRYFERLVKLSGGTLRT